MDLGVLHISFIPLRHLSPLDVAIAFFFYICQVSLSIVTF